MVKGSLLGSVGLLLLVGALWALAGCAPPPPERSLERVRQSGELVVGLDPTYPPFEVVDGAGELVGYDVDLAREIASRLGVVPRFVAVDVGGIHDGLLARKFDAIVSSVPPYPELSKQIAFSRPYFNAGQVLVVRDDESRFERIEDVATGSVAVETASTADLEMRGISARLPDLAVRRVSSPALALDEVRAGRVDAALVDAISAYEYVARTGGVKIVGSPITVEPYVVCTRKVDVGLSEEIDRIIGELELDGTLGQLQRRWVEGRKE